MTYLADVNVICEPSKLRPNERVLQWLDEHEAVTTGGPDRDGRDMARDFDAPARAKT